MIDKLLQELSLSSSCHSFLITARCEQGLIVISEKTRPSGLFIQNQGIALIECTCEHQDVVKAKSRIEVPPNRCASQAAKICIRSGTHKEAESASMYIAMRGGVHKMLRK